MLNDALSSLTDDELLRRFGERVRRDNEQVAEMLREIDEIDRRQIWARLGHPSMFDFCVVRFHMSESRAYKRIGAARMARRFPVIFGMVARAEVHLSGVLKIGPHLTDENHREVLGRATHKTVKEIERLVAELAPQPDVASRVRAVPRRSAPAAAPAPAPAPPSEPGASPSLFDSLEPASADAPSPTPASKRAPDPRPLSPRRYELRCTMDEETHGVLVELQGLLAHQIPNGDPGLIVARALRVLRDETLKKKAAVTTSPRSSKPRSSRARDIPAHIRRTVWERDGGRCTFVGEDGHVCGETRGLEFAHGDPWAKGGEHSVENIRLRCRPHNRHEADRDYGELFMALKRGGSGERDGVRETPAMYGAVTAHVGSAWLVHVSCLPWAVPSDGAQSQIGPQPLTPRTTTPSSSSTAG